MTPVIPDNLRVARRSLQDIAEIVDIGDWCFREAEGIWSLGLYIRCQVPTDLIPEITGWQFLASPEYPLGPIRVMPDSQAGIASTFPHQRANTINDPTTPWRSGSICTGTHLQQFGRQVLTDEPWSPNARLHWYAERAVGWVQAAADGTLIREDDPFEKPDFKRTDNYKHRFAFIEKADTFRIWSISDAVTGIVDLVESGSGDGTLLLEHFRDRRGKLVMSAPWNSRIRHTRSERLQGIWIRVSDVPIMPPYNAPTSVGELVDVLGNQGIDFWKTMKELCPRIRSRSPLVIMLGFPVKNEVRDEWSSIHWQAGMLAPLTQKSTQVKGFRPSSKYGRWRSDRMTTLRAENLIDWRPTSNWSQDAITSRGSLTNTIVGKKFLVVGAGSLGSMVAEQLARAGVTEITVIDDDFLEIGNLTRHQLNLSDLYTSKALSLAARLNLISPNTDAVGLNERFLPKLKDIEKFDVLVDTTGSDEIAYAFFQANLTPKMVTISVSVGYKAKRLYFFGYAGELFPADRFLAFVQPLAAEDNTRYGGENPPREDLGCFHPVFPARDDDMQLLAACAVKEIERFLMTGRSEAAVTFSQLNDDDYFSGVKRHEHVA